MKATLLGPRRPDEAGRRRLARSLAALAADLGVGHCAAAVLFTDDEGIRDYNRRFRGADEATDVLAFPAGAGDPQAAGHYLGDLVISTERAADQAAEHGHDELDEIEVLLLHGLLHLLGHDHETDGGEMAALELGIARRVLGSTRGLIARAADAVDVEGARA